MVHLLVLDTHRRQKWTRVRFDEPSRLLDSGSVTALCTSLKLKSSHFAPSSGSARKSAASCIRPVVSTTSPSDLRWPRRPQQQAVLQAAR
jgi:hypothetical protein